MCAEMRNPGALVGVGRTAEVYAWEAGWVVKLFHEWVSPDTVEYEARLARVVHAAGLPVPAVGEMVEVNGRWGLVYERVEAVTMLSVFRSQLWRVGHFARLLADLHVKMHTCHAPGLPSQRERLQNKIERAQPLPEALRQAVLEALSCLPDDDRLCHGDFHPDNVLMTGRGPVIVDWIDAARGHPMADMARTVLLVSKGSLPPGTPLAWLIQVVRGRFTKTYLQRYFQERPGEWALLEAWLPVVAAARLNEGIDSEEQELIQIVRSAFGEATG